MSNSAIWTYEGPQEENVAELKTAPASEQEIEQIQSFEKRDRI